MAYRRAMIMGLAAFFAVLAIDPAPSEAPRSAPQPTAEQIDAAMAYASLQAKQATEPGR
jgi:hypothetical protein